MARLFFALWPDPRVARGLAEVAQALAPLAAGKPVPAEKIHLTLAFLGEVDASRVELARECAAATRGEPFELVLDEVGAFRNAKVAWAGCSKVPAALVEAQARLAAGLCDRGFLLEERPFAAHVTLARRIGSPVPLAPMPKVRWKVREFVLVRSSGGRYFVEERWELR